jgi:hypothetical protein
MEKVEEMVGASYLTEPVKEQYMQHYLDKVKRIVSGKEGRLQ